MNVNTQSERDVLSSVSSYMSFVLVSGCKEVVQSLKGTIWQNKK